MLAHWRTISEVCGPVGEVVDFPVLPRGRVVLEACSGVGLAVISGTRLGDPRAPRADLRGRGHGWSDNRNVARFLRIAALIAGKHDNTLVGQPLGLHRIFDLPPALAPAFPNEPVLLAIGKECLRWRI